LWNEYDATYTIGDNNTYSRAKAIAKGYANNSGRIVLQETTRWENRAKAMALSASNADVTNQVKALIGNDPWMSAREIAEEVVAKDVSPKLNPLEERVSTIEGDDNGKSMRAVALEVLGDVNIEGDLSAFITQINSNTAKIETLVGSDKKTSARAIANDAISKKTTTLEDAATSQDDDGLVTAKDAIDYFGGKLNDAISKEIARADKAYAPKSDVNRIDGEIAGIEASISDLEEDIKGVDAKADNALDKADKALADISELDASVKSSFDDIGATFDTLDSVITGFNTTATNALTKATEVEAEVESNTKTIAEHTEIVTMLNNRCDSIEDTAEELESQISQIETNVTSLDEHIDEVESKADSALTQLSGVVGDVQTAKDLANSAVATANDVEKKANNNEANIERLGQNVVGIENTLGSLNTTITQVSKKADNAVSQAESATTKANEALSLAGTASQNADKANNTITGVSNLVSNLRTTVEGHTSEIADIEGDVAENKAKIEAIEEDYISKGEAVDFATDLTGVIEATPEEFVYRPSAGEKSIRDKSAVIRRIKGNSVVWEQKIQAIPKRENFEGATTYYDYDTNECVVQNISRTSNYTSGSTRLEIKPDYYSVPNHVYLLLSDKHYKGIGVHSYTSGFQNVNTIKRYTAKDIINFRIDKTFDWVNVCPVGSEIRFRMMFFDLTATFGEGNEPATVEEFRKVYNEAYYPYCPPELRGVKTGAIKTVGFNLFDGECARVIGGMTYIVSNYAAAYYSETKNGAQTAVLIKDGVYTPECSGYLYLEGTADATPCVHFQHSGVMDGECAPYVEHILNLPEILKLFPNGMHGLRNTYHDVYDEINIDNYIKRLEIVDLGSLWWNSDSSRQCFHAPLNTHKVRGIALCTRYTCSTLGSISDKQLSTHNYYGNARIFIKDADFDNPTDFMASLKGVYLVYELNEPIITPLSEPIALDYYCEDWGSEEAIPASSASAPFRADIVYQFNAEGRIRDNSRNIDKLEKQLQRAKEDIQNAGVQSDWLDDNPDSKAFIKNKPTMPTRVATAPEVIGTESIPSSMLPNVVYIVSSGLERFTLPTLEDGVANAHNVWKIIFVSPASANMTLPDNIVWKDGIAPNWAEAGGYCELVFAKLPNSWILGEWKIYK
jgi:predicted  nucleic acid-binding Zn-ribbon protein